jgi:hypothetical protein
MWTDFVDDFLQEMICLEGRGSHCDDLCSQCVIGKATLRCRDCFGGEMYCSACIVEIHQCQPLHRTEVRVFASSTQYEISSFGSRHGMAHSSSFSCSKALVFIFNLVTQSANPVLILRSLLQTISWSWTHTGSISLVLISVGANPLNHIRHNFFERNGSPRLLPIRRQPQRSVFWRSFTCSRSSRKCQCLSSIIVWSGRRTTQEPSLTR